MLRHKLFLILVLVALVSILVAGCGPATTTAGKIKVYGVFATQLTEPWDQAIHRALVAMGDNIEYRYGENLGYSGGLEQDLKRAISQWKPDLIIGDAFGNEEAVRRVAAQNPKIAFLFGSAGAQVQPNMSVFDNWNVDGSYAAGQVAAKFSKSHVLGVVAGKDVGEVNRLVWGFIQGARSVDSKVTVLTTYIDSWYDPAKAKEHAKAKIEAGADFLYCERVGCEQAAREAKSASFIIGQMVDSYDLAPDNTVTSVVWDMFPTVKQAVNLVKAKAWTAQDMGSMSLMVSGGTTMGEVRNNIESKLPGVRSYLASCVQAVKAGGVRPDIIESKIPAKYP